ncbi:MAG TPA: hypothetical protein VFV33_19730 [Gemmatimonadaceae bacterium]|nr:hypothetical protein [Gemmatimonadaceae bacterium]
MGILRTLILAIVVTLGTVLVGWWLVPVLALGFGVVMRGAPRPGATAALAGALGWGGYLAVVALGGGPVGSFAASLAASMKLPAWAPLAATLLFPALLAGPAAYLGARLADRYISPA